MSEYDVLNDIIRYLASKVRNFSGFAMFVRTPHDVAMVRPRKKTKSNPSMQILAWQVTPKRPRDLHELRPRL
jgi:hypothetical protein